MTIDELTRDSIFDTAEIKDIKESLKEIKAKVDDFNESDTIRATME
jgi:hypothetical protein